MIVLAIDTALQACSSAIVRDGVCLAKQFTPLEKGHAEWLAPMAAEVFAEAGLAPKDLDRVGVVVGPGGFTGLRVGLAFARALTLGTGAKAVGVNSLQALAHMLNGKGLRATVIDARRGQVYSALYDDNGAEILPPFVSEPEVALCKLQDAAGDNNCVLTGTGASLLPEAPDSWRRAEGDGQIDPLTVAALTIEAPDPKHLPAPIYLRAPDAKKSGASLFDGLSPV